jgi:acyl carrier protein
MSEVTALENRIKQLLVKHLRLKMEPEQIDADMLLFGGELGLDSIDALEIVVGLEKEFGVAITDQNVGEKVLRTVSSIAAYLAECGVK